MNGGADGDDEPSGSESKCANNVVCCSYTSSKYYWVSAIQQQITRVNEALVELNLVRKAVSLVNQLQNLSMIETMTDNASNY